MRDLADDDLVAGLGFDGMPEVAEGWLSTSCCLGGGGCIDCVLAAVGTGDGAFPWPASGCPGGNGGGALPCV